MRTVTWRCLNQISIDIVKNAVRINIVYFWLKTFYICSIKIFKSTSLFKQNFHNCFNNSLVNRLLSISTFLNFWAWLKLFSFSFSFVIKQIALSQGSRELVGTKENSPKSREKSPSMPDRKWPHLKITHFVINFRKMLQFCNSLKRRFPTRPPDL